MECELPQDGLATSAHPMVAGTDGGACVGSARVLQSMEPTVVGMSMKALLQFGAAITNLAGIGLVGSDIEYLVYISDRRSPNASCPKWNYLYMDLR